MSQQGKIVRFLTKNSRPSVPLRTKYDQIRDCNSSTKLCITYFATSKSLSFCSQLP